ncbi:MAG: hypothetical protein II879_00755, partial [Clostridia bacterium]|nr:hypothetical protein [Clostridia bacterium]
VINPQTIDVLPSQTFTVTASWLPEGWNIEGIQTTMDYQLIDGGGYEEDTLKNITIDETTLTAMIETPGYYTLSLRLYADIINWPNYAYITVRNPDGSLPVLTPKITSSPEEMQGTIGTAKNPYYPYDDVSGSLVGYLGIGNCRFFEQHGKSFDLEIAKIEVNAPDLVTVQKTQATDLWYEIYLGEPDTIIPATAVGDWHYVLTLTWDGGSETINSHLLVKPAPVVFTLPANLTTIEAEAFVGVQADVFVIPTGVTSIDPSAFDSGVRLRVVEGSYAEQFAWDNGFDIEYQ